MQQVSEPWFTWEMNVLSRMEHALNIPQCKGIRSIDRKRCVDPGIVYGVVSEFVACERKIIVDRLSHQFFFFFFIPFHVTVAHRRSRIRSRFIWIGFKWHLFFSSFFFLLYYSMIYMYSMIFFVFFSVRLIVECLLIRASDGDFNFQATKHDGELERRRACAWNINEFTGERIL